MADNLTAAYRGTPWRHPAEETVDLYPGLTVCDDRVSGSITAGRTRLPLWAFIYTAVVEGWPEAEHGWSPSDYGWTAERMGAFLADLLEMRGEFGRLLLVLANAERLEGEIHDAWASEITGPEGGLIQIKLGPDDPNPDAHEPPPAWWEDAALRQPVIEQLRRCLACLEET